MFDITNLGGQTLSVSSSRLPVASYYYDSSIRLSPTVAKTAFGCATLIGGPQMKSLSWLSIAFYCVFCIFVIYQQLHVKNFRGSSQSFVLALNMSALAGMLTGFAYLAYYGWSVVWWAPVVIFAVGLVASGLGLFM